LNIHVEELTPEEIEALAQHVQVGARQFLPEAKAQELLTLLATRAPATDPAAQVMESYAGASGYGRGERDTQNRGAMLAERVERDKQRAADSAAVQNATENGLSRAGEDALRMRFGLPLRPLSGEDIAELFKQKGD